MPVRKRFLLWLGVVALVLGAWAFWLEPASLRLVTYEEPVANWPVACTGFKVAVLADLHVGSPFNDLEQLAKIVALTNSASPDLVLIAGDFVIQDVIGGTFVSPEEAARVLAGLTSTLGTFAVLGNHDWWLDAARVENALSSAGITVLEDRNRQVGQSGCRFTLAGISDYWEGAHDIGKALAQRDPSLPVVAFTHNPDLIPQLPAGVTYLIAGHTHGGQVNFPLVGRLIVPSEFGERFAAGPIDEAGHRGFVNTGTGTSILPVRFRVPPEVSLLVLTPAN